MSAPVIQYESSMLTTIAGLQSTPLESLKRSGFLRGRNITPSKQWKGCVTSLHAVMMSVYTKKQVVDGTNAYAVMQSPRASGAEAIVISASWLSRTGEGDGTLNLRGVATVISLAQYLKSQYLNTRNLMPDSRETETPRVFSMG